MTSAERTSTVGVDGPVVLHLTEDKDHVIRELIEALTLYSCAGRRYRVACDKVSQDMWDGIIEPSRPDGIAMIGTGSYWEGMPRQVCSDKDYMLTYSTWPSVVSEYTGLKSSTLRERVTKVNSHVLAESNIKHPAFLRLRVTGHTGSLPSSVVVGGYIDSDKWAALFNIEGTERHGPARTLAAFPKITEEGMVDLVPCLRSPCWPPISKEFFSRARSSGWPPEQLLVGLTGTGCHIVGKAAPNSDRPELDFRWSFSVAEKFLCHEMDDKMAACMYLLKSIKKKHWNDSSLGMCSFLFKTACFWTFEQEANTSVLSLAYAALDWLIMCYADCNIPHYFVRGHNLIAHLSADVCYNIASQLKIIKEDFPGEALHCIKIEKEVLDLVQSLSTKLQVPMDVLSDDCDGRQLCNLISKHTKGDQELDVLRKITLCIMPGSDLFAKKDLNSFVWHLMVIQLGAYGHVMGDIPDDGCVPPGRPEALLNRTLKNLPSLVSRDLIKSIETSLYWVIGDVYLKSIEIKRDQDLKAEGKDWLYDVLNTDKPLASLKLESDQNEHIQEVKRLGEYYFRQTCAPMHSPDGSTDDGFLGKVNMAKFYFITGEHREFERMVQELEKCLNQNTMDEWGLMMIKGLSGLVRSAFEYITQKSSHNILHLLTNEYYPDSNLTAACAAWVFLIIRARRDNNQIKLLVSSLGFMKSAAHWLNTWYYAGSQSDRAVIRTAISQIMEEIPSEWTYLITQNVISKLRFLNPVYSSCQEPSLD